MDISEQNVKQILVLVFKGNKVTLDMIKNMLEKILSQSIRQVHLSQDKGEQELSKFLKNHDNFISQEIQDCDQKLLNQVLKEFRVPYAVERNDEQPDITVVKFATSPEKLIEIMKIYEQRNEIKIGKQKKKEELKEKRKEIKQRKRNVERGEHAR